MRVLLVEDEPLLAMLLEESLADLGHEPVGAAANVEQAHALLDLGPVDCALLDFSLGATDTSVEIAQRLERLCVPFCYLSGHTSLENDSGAPEAPLLTKPVAMDALSRALEAMAALRPRADCPSGQGSPA